MRFAIARTKHVQDTSDLSLFLSLFPPFLLLLSFLLFSFFLCLSFTSSAQRQNLPLRRCRVPLDARRKFRVIFPARLKNSITAELSVVRASLRALASQRRSLARFFSRLSLLNQFRQRQVAAIRSDRTGNVSRTFTQVMEFSWTLFLLLFSVSLSPSFFLFHREL